MGQSNEKMRGFQRQLEHDRHDTTSTMPTAIQSMVRVRGALEGRESVNDIMTSYMMGNAHFVS